MIINLRGTSGSGKSTIVRDILEQSTQKLRIKEAPRRQPVGYLATVPWASGRIAIPGHYESACGGCDTLPGYDYIFQKVESGILNAHHVIFEGLLVSEEVKRTLQLHENRAKLPPRAELRVILLDTPVEECLASIRARREARGDTRPLKEDNTRNRVAVIERSCQRLAEAGVPVHRTDRDGAAALVREWLS